MPVRGTVSSVRSHILASPFASTSRIQACVQLRHYATPGSAAKGKPQRVRFQNKKGEKGEPQAPSKNVKRIGTFLPLPANQLKHPLFNADKREELKFPTFNARNVAKGAAGKILQFTRSEHSILRAYGVPKNLLVEFRVLSQPCSVVRDITLSVAETLETASLTPSTETRAVLTGPNGSGKSFVLLQAVEYCSSKDWIVLYVPRAIDLVNSSTQYIYDERTRTYHQPEFTYELLRRFQQVNSVAIGKLKVTKKRDFGKRTVLPDTPLAELISIAVKDHAQAPFVFDAVLNEVSRQTQHPVLLAIDDFQALYCNTYYKDEQFLGIKPYSLSLPRLLLEYASGTRYFARGAVLGAVSCTDTYFKTPVELREALGLPHHMPVNPYLRRSPELVGYSKGLKNIVVPERFQISEAASVFHTWHRDVALHSKPSDENFLTMFTEASGNPRNFVWKGMVGSFMI